MVEKLEKFIESVIIQGISHIFDHKTVHFGCPSVLTFLPPFRRHLCEFPAGFGLSAAASATPRDGEGYNEALPQFKTKSQPLSTKPWWMGISTFHWDHRVFIIVMGS